MYPVLLNFDNYKVRCSGLGKVMTEPQSGNPREKYDEAVSELRSFKEVQLAKIEEEKLKLGNLDKEKAVKTWEKQDLKVKNLEADFKTKLAKKTLIVSELEKSKDDIILSDTCVQYLLEVYIEARSGRRKDITNRYIKKGNENEDNSIEILSEVDDAFYVKNQSRIHDEFIEGECDIEHEDENGKKVIKDIKSSWDYFTFMKNTTDKKPKDIYWWQGQGYMRLYVADLYELAHVLTNTPSGIIEDEKKRLLWAMGSNRAESEAYIQGCQEIDINSTYPDLPIYERVFKQYFEKEDLDERINARVIECRKWLNNYAKSVYIYIQKQVINAIGMDRYVKENPDAVFFVEKERLEIGDVPEIIEDTNETISDIKLPTSQEERPEEPTPEEFEEYFEQQEINLGLSLPKDKSVKEKIMDIVLEESGAIEESVIEELEVKEAEYEDVDTVTEDIVTEEKVEFTEKIVQEVSEEIFLQTSLVDISLLKSVEECLDKYRILKPHFEKYPKIKEALFNKKASFAEPEVKAEVSKPPVISKPPVTSKPPMPKPKTEEPTPKTEPEPKPEPAETEPTSDAKKIELLKKETDKCKTSDEVKALFGKHADFIRANEELKTYMIEVGKRLPTS